MANAETRSQRAQDRAARAAIRNQDYTRATAILQADRAPDPAVIDDPGEDESNVVSPQGQAVAGRAAVARQRQSIRAMKQWAGDMKRTVDAQGVQLATLAAKVETLTAQLEEAHGRLDRHAEAFEEFHGEASGYRDNMNGTLAKVAQALTGYIDGLNTGESPSNPQLLGIARAMSVLSDGSDIYAIVAAALTYTAYTSPLSAEGGTTTTTTSNDLY